MDELGRLLTRLTEASGVSGYEHEVRALVMEEMRPLVDETKTDALGNAIGIKRGNQTSSVRRSVMLAAHMDEIGLMVTKLDRGFLRFTEVGGFDPRVLPGQEVVVHGRKSLLGVIATRPPHLLSEEERQKPLRMEDMYIDMGLPTHEIEEAVRVGDIVTIRREAVTLQNGHLSGKAMDDRAAVSVVLRTLSLLQGLRHSWDVFAVATVQEEVGMYGAMTSAYGISPTCAVALDVGFGDQPGVPDYECLELGKGPGITLGANIHPRLHQRLVQIAQRYDIPYQLEPSPGSTGTDAWAIQVAREGIPTALLSLPLRNMHTSVELLDVSDCERASRLLARFIAGLEEPFCEELTCF